MIHAHGLAAPKAWIPAETVLDIGAGIRPVNWGTPKEHFCVEPHGPYADVLAAAGYPVLRVTALEALEATANIRPGAFDAIYLLDVIEHMTRDEGMQVLELVLAALPKQIIVFTPYGFAPQEHDAWNMGGEHWQTHRSGWVPADFIGWEIEHHSSGAFFATWTAEEV